MEISAVFKVVVASEVKMTPAVILVLTNEVVKYFLIGQFLSYSKIPMLLLMSFNYVVTS